MSDLNQTMFVFDPHDQIAKKIAKAIFDICEQNPDAFEGLSQDELAHDIALRSLSATTSMMAFLGYTDEAVGYLASHFTRDHAKARRKTDNIAVVEAIVPQLRKARKDKA